ncbi:drug resistance transporter, EmrB/QacA family [Myxococcus xanthus DK 1622]|uniref:Drug resistance transporter, EmrB/QacA family n=1 Tax=Myxococcus xanthus (strain DK1622) TaxID=246197 RepID=Q1D3J6_MYXXD|nr:MFS transporter [Myxococcus sp. CA005]ABF89056.1 drug resistance transporter, EmrB/QacA family [Myxococcus xanthus DK 1622]NOJ52635.1 MFS transporter [Myxococcus xanthus]QVW66239.1 MFS transporter [Myxococcus xanthus DZ2]QPM77170.1 MFS transporter [Myxococcus xanthus]UEO07634.1 MFS transporter [Myxococcus xanthus DZ2]
MPGHPASSSAEAGGDAPRGSRLASIAVASALFMEFVDSTALSTALPRLSLAFGTDPIHLKLALTSYILALAVLAPASGWVADRFGPRRVFMLAMSVFLLGSVLCGFSQSLTQLVIFRTLQGLGGALMTPVGRIIVVSSAPRERLVAALSWFTMPALVGPLVGPPLAGLILGVADWPWIFFINVPVGILGMLAVARFVPPLHQPDPGPFDTRGFVLVAVAITTLIGAAETVGIGLMPLSLQLGLAAVAFLSLGAYVWHALRVERPVLNLRLLRIDTFRASMIGGTLTRMGLGASPFLLPLLFQVGLGWTPVEAGLVTIGGGVGALACKSVAPYIIRRFGFRQTLIFANLTSAVLTAMPAFFRNSTPIPLIVGVLMVSGFMRSMQFTAINTVAYADIPPDTVSNASTLSVVTMQMALGLGISFGGLMLHLARGAGEAPLTPDRFVLPFIAVGIMSSLAGPLYRRLSPNAGAHIGGRRVG